MALNPQALSGMFTGSMSSMGDQIVTWIGYSLTGVLIIAALFAVYIYTQYKYNTPIVRVSQTGYGKPKWERARIIKEKGIVKWKLLLRMKKIKPVPYEFIEKNKVMLLQSDAETFTPIKEKVQVKDEEGKQVYVKTLIPVDKDNKYWYQLQERENAKDYQPDDLARKQMMIVFGTIILVLVFVGFMVWLSFKYNLGAAKELRAGLETVAKSGWFDNVQQGFVPN